MTKFKKGRSFPPEPTQEEAIPAAEEVKTEQAEKKVERVEEKAKREEKDEEEEGDKKEVVVGEETKDLSLGNSIDQVSF